MRRRRSGLPPIGTFGSFSSSQQVPQFHQAMGPTECSPPTTESPDASWDSAEALNTDSDDAKRHESSCQALNRRGANGPTTFDHSGEQFDCENACNPYRLESLQELLDVLRGITFDRVSKWGKPITIKQPKDEYL